jgi:transposase
MELVERVRRGRLAINLAEERGVDTRKWKHHLEQLLEEVQRIQELDEGFEPWILSERGKRKRNMTQKYDHESLYDIVKKYQKTPYRRYRRVSEADVIAVREGIEIGWTAEQIREVTNVGLSSISRIKRGKGLYARYGPSLGSQRSGPVPPDILAAVKQGVEQGMSYADLRSQFGVTPSTVAEVKRSMGLLDPVSNAGPDEPEHGVAPPEIAVVPAEQPEPTPRLVKAIRIAMGEMDYWEGTASELLAMVGPRGQGIPRNAIRLSTVLGMPHMIDALKTDGIAVERHRSGGARSIHLTRSGITAPQEEPQQADSSYTPQQYFEAISEGIEEYHRHLAVLEARIGDLTLQNKDLHDAALQARAKMSAWAGPGPIPTRNMSTGG